MASRNKSVTNGMAAAGEGDLLLLGKWSSPFVMRVRFALGLKRVPYELVEENVFSDMSELLLKSNPVHKKVPVLLHGDRSISESMVIVEYIDDVWKGEGVLTLLPSDPYDKAMTRFWASYIDNTWFPSFRGLKGGNSPEEVAATVEQIFAGLLLLEDVLKKGGKPFFGGETIGYLDIAMGSHISWIKNTVKLVGFNFLEETKTPLLVAWGERFLAVEAVKEVLPETDKLIEFFGTMIPKTAAAAAK